MKTPPTLRSVFLCSFGYSLVARACATWLLCDHSPLISAEPMRALSKEPLHFPEVPPVPPAEAEKTFETLHGFQMQLLAAEPMVASPVAITYDEDGRAFVCEMTDYPYTDKAHHKPSQENPTDAPIGKVVLLQSTKHDGVFDKSTVFADGLSWPTGAACWKGGIIVVATPDIWYFKDTKGTGVADVRLKLFTGLKKLNVQAVANNPIWGLDNKIYIAGGSNGGTLVNLVHPEEKPITFRRNDLVLDPVKMTIELASGGARYGNTRDDWGNRFLCNIRNPLEHVVIDQRYLSRNPYLPPTSPLQDVAESGDQLPVYRISPPEAWRKYRAKRWSADPAVVAHMPRSELVGAGVVTSSSGCTIYRGDAYPPEYRGMAFVCECAGNLFYRLKLTPDGVTFKGTRIDGKKEIVASRDVWFRPVNFANAPDGTLTVCDMYREVIEHPWSLPDDIHAALDLEKGRDKGRLYRLAPPDFKPRKAESLSNKSTAELVALLAHPNAWHRDTAHRLLFERQDKEAVPLLEKMMEEVPVNALARVEAMWTLDGVKMLSNDVLMQALTKNTEWDLKHVRENALKLTEQFLPKWRKPDDKYRESLRGGRPIPPECNLSKSEDILEGHYQSVLNSMNDESLRVRFQATLSLGLNPGPGVVDTVSWFGIQDAANPWMRTAVMLSSSGALASNVLNFIVEKEAYDGRTELFVQSAQMVGSCANDADCGKALHSLRIAHKLNPSLAEDAFAALAERLRARGKSLDTCYPYEPFARLWVASLLSDKTKTVLDSDATSEGRTRAIALLALLDFPQLQPIATKLLLPIESDAIRVATIQLLGQQHDAKVADLLLEAWPTLTPTTREAALQVIAGRAPLIGALLDAVETNRIKPSEIGPTTRTLLSRTTDPKLRERAAKLFGGSASRQEVIAKYQSALSLKGDAEAGHKVYQTICATCHRKGEEGRDIGPNLATIQNWTPDQILVNVLDPNREVVANFILYVVETNDGRTLSGLITSENAGSIGLKGPDGAEQSLPRADIKSLKSTGLSLMPEGLEAAITPQQMADVIAFLRG